ncbi:MAG: protein tyrosine phosphatase [Kouleothrix sp.]|jgi:protein-tyrosine-phosphatase|nr:protein tyrosine phosphatase [Kouleothrix sp.]
MTGILLVGAADTGRAPMAAALLARLAEQRGYRWAVESAGVLGHDGAAAEVEARDTMLHMGLDIGEHQARSLDDDIARRADLIVAIDSGTALVVRARFPAAAPRTFGLGELAGRARDVPDPFRMQIGAWMTYARELERLLEAALPRMVELLPAGDEGPTVGDERATPGSPAAVASPAAPPPIAGERAAAATRIAGLLQVAVQMPDVLDWAAARGRIEADLAAIAAAPAEPSDLIAAYVGLLRAALALLPPAPSPAQLAALQQAAEKLRAPVGQDALVALSSTLATLPRLP